MGLPEKKTDLRVMTSVNFSLHSDQMSQGVLMTVMCLELLSLVKYLEGLNSQNSPFDSHNTWYLVNILPAPQPWWVSGRQHLWSPDNPCCNSGGPTTCHQIIVLSVYSAFQAVPWPYWRKCGFYVPVLKIRGCVWFLVLSTGGSVRYLANPTWLFP